MRKLKKTVSILLSVILVFSLFTIVPFEVGAVAESIQYIDRSWDPETKQVEQTTETVYDYTVLTTDTNNTYLAQNGWYVVTDNVTLKGFVSQGDNVNLLICDGAKLTCNEGLTCDVNGSTHHINIFSQQNDSGKLIANGKTDYAGIGGWDDTSGGVITIHGGKITAKGGADGAGIGGGNHGNAGTITIYGGEITAAGGDASTAGGGAGIGGGNEGNGGTITIYGGIITATGGVSTYNGAAAGIGGGDNGRSGNITINDGTITATGGSSGAAGAGIGGGDQGNVDTITINGGKIVKAFSSMGSGIGSGRNENPTKPMNGTITINGGIVNASSNHGAGIGSSYKDIMGGTINITGGTVNAESNENGAGIGSGEQGNCSGTISITGGTVNAVAHKEGAGIGSGERGNCSGTISIAGDSVYAVSIDGGAGIGSGEQGKCSAPISITGGTVEAVALYGGDAIHTPPHAIGGGTNVSERGTITIADGLMVRSGDDKSSAVWRFRENRVNGTKDRYTLISPCTRHIEEPQDGDPIWSNYEIVDETNHTQHCVACNAAKELLLHDFSDPVWTWGENYSTATAKFTCPTCHFETTLDATVKQEETQDGMVKAMATVECLGTTYTDEQNTGMQALRYIKRSWDEENKQVKETPETLLNYTVLTSTNETYWAADGWYVVNDNVTLKRFVSQGDDVNILLCDDAKLTCSEGLICDTNQDGVVHSVNIFAQENGTGELVATGSTDDDSAGIGGWKNKHGGVITIHGGKITATGEKYAAGIGGGNNGNGGTVTIYGGNITATGGEDAAGIGGGDNGHGGTIDIYGGTVNATSSNHGAGIGGGCDGNGGTVNIYGGTVTATSNNNGAGIGGGYDGEDNGTLTIADGWMVRSGDNADSTDWRWQGNRVNACQRDSYAKIYPCDVHENETYGGYEVWDKNFKPDDDATHSYTCKACNGDVNIQNHDIAVSWTWAPDCSEATAHFSCATCGFSKDVTASGDQIVDEIVDPSTNEHKFTATVTLAGNDYTGTFSGYPVNYTDLDGETQPAYAILITSGTTNMTNGWYAVTSNVTNRNRIVVNGAVNLILCDGARLDAKCGISVEEGQNLTIWGQRNNAGELKAQGTRDNIVIYGAGIGGGYKDTGYDHYNAGSITINGGTINSTGYKDCAGIGGGIFGSAEVTINGGIVTATTDKKGYAAGIGSGGTRNQSSVGHYGKVTITGGTVIATGGDSAAAIGGGQLGKGEVTITGGNITANSGGIGDGREMNFGSNLGDYTISPERGSVTLDYGENGVSVFSQEYHNTDITLSKAFTDGTNIHQPGAVTEDAIKDKTLTPYDGMGSRLAGHSVSLEGDIAVNFYMELSNDIAASQTAYMQFSVPNTSKEYQNQTVKVSKAEKKGNYYVFKCRVAAKDMNSKITAQLIDGDSKGIKYTYSVKEYADYLIAHQNESDEFSKAGPLVTAMLNYGKNAEYYFDKTGDKPDDIDIDIPEYTSTVHALPEGVTFEGATLSLKSQTTLSLYFNSDTMPTLTADTGVTYETDKTSENEYVIRIRGIAAYDLNKLFTVYVNGTKAVEYSPLTYCYKAQNNSNTKLVNTVKALYQYWHQADLYFKNQGGN